MTTPNSTATAAAILKSIYSAFPHIASLVYSENPTLALMTKDEEGGGDLVKVPFKYANGAGTAQDFASAVTGASAIGVGNWAVVGKTVHTVAQLALDLVAQSETNEMAFTQAAKMIVDGKFEEHANTLGKILWGSGTGTIGKMSSISGSGLIQLTNIEDVTNFEVDMTLQSTDTDGGTPLAALGYVKSIDRSLGQVQMASAGIGGAAALPSAWATSSPYLVVKGTLNLYAPGIQGFLPASAPTAGVTFYGFDRAIDTDRCAGLRFDASGYNMEEALIDGTARLGVAGGKPDIIAMNPTDLGRLAKSMSSKVWVEMKGPANIGFQALQVMTTKGPVPCLGDRSCPVHHAFPLELKGWKLLSVGKQPHIEGFDGLDWLRIAGSDAAEIRLNTRLFAPVTQEPGHNMHITNFGQ